MSCQFCMIDSVWLDHEHPFVFYSLPTGRYIVTRFSSPDMQLHYVTNPFFNCLVPFLAFNRILAHHHNQYPKLTALPNKKHTFQLHNHSKHACKVDAAVTDDQPVIKSGYLLNEPDGDEGPQSSSYLPHVMPHEWCSNQRSPKVSGIHSQ